MDSVISGVRRSAFHAAPSTLYHPTSSSSLRRLSCSGPGTRLRSPDVGNGPSAALPKAALYWGIIIASPIATHESSSIQFETPTPALNFETPPCD